MDIRVDLYSDTHTLPTAAMRRAMAEADVGDEQAFEDPTVNRLCRMVAELMSKEAAVYLPSGTMCNEIAYRVHCRPGDEIIVDRTAHGLNFEAGGPAALAGAMLRPIDGERGIFTAAQVRTAVRGPLRHHPPGRCGITHARASCRWRTPATWAAARCGRSRAPARSPRWPASTAWPATWTARG
jgi:threonine aldolase